MTNEGDYQTPFGYSLHYRIDGTGAEKVFLVIGFSSCGAYWGPLVDAIHSTHPGRYTTCIYDQRGVGKSTTCAFEKCSTTTIARDVLGLLLHLEWIGKHTPLHLIGWSMGGFASIEFVNMLLREIGGLLNLTSLTLCNTGHKFTFPAAKALIPGFTCFAKGILSLIFGIPTKWMVPDILKVHYSPTYLADRERYEKLVAEYGTRSPFNAPMTETAVALLQHMYAVLTHYVPRSRMKAIRESGLPIHAVVSSEDLLIHPTASITLSRYLDCDFSYLPGGHMSHCIHTDIIIERLVSIWDAGLSRKFPHYRMSNQAAAPTIPRTMSLAIGRDLQLSNVVNGKVFGSLDWPMTESLVVHKLNEVMMQRMDRWSVSSLVSRFRKPGRLIIAPALVLPIVIVQLRKIFCVPKLSRKDRMVETGLLLYVFVLIFVVQEVTRGEG
jgi:pimeloyl-ACP methyl ester carboxylesterase